MSAVIAPPYEAVAIGGSAGAINAVETILLSLSKDFPLNIFVVLHRDPKSDSRLAKLFSDKTGFSIKEVYDKEIIEPNTFYLAPSNYHLLIEEDRTFALSVDEKIKFARPSIDVFFKSAADVYAARIIGVILSGASDDGAEGLVAIKKNGGLTIVQDPLTADSKFMPASSIEKANPDLVLPLKEMGAFLDRTIRERGGHNAQY